MVSEKILSKSKKLILNSSTKILIQKKMFNAHVWCPI